MDDIVAKIIGIETKFVISKAEGIVNGKTVVVVFLKNDDGWFVAAKIKDVSGTDKYHYFFTLFFARRYYRKLVKKYRLKETE